MGSYRAISDVGKALVDLLRDRLGDLLDPTAIELADPSGVGGGNSRRLTLYLYRVEENPQLNNAERTVEDATVRRSPLVLDLYYLLTAHPAEGGDETARTGEQHSVLGRALQVFHDDGVLEAVNDEGPTGDPTVRVSPVAVPLDELLSVWNALGDMPYQPSMAYTATPVVIDSQVATPVEAIEEVDTRYVVRGESGTWEDGTNVNTE